jgi:hypothetical protein
VPSLVHRKTLQERAKRSEVLYSSSSDSTTIIASSSPGTVFIMLNKEESFFIGTCLEGFFYGKISDLCALTTLAKEVQLFPGPGLYSGIFVMYLQCPSKKSRTAFTLFYALCLLYVLCTASMVTDLLVLILNVSNNSICEEFFYQLCRRVA